MISLLMHVHALDCTSLNAQKRKKFYSFGMRMHGGMHGGMFMQQLLGEPAESSLVMTKLMCWGDLLSIWRQLRGSSQELTAQGSPVVQSAHTVDSEERLRL